MSSFESSSVTHRARLGRLVVQDRPTKKGEAQGQSPVPPHIVAKRTPNR